MPTRSGSSGTFGGKEAQRQIEEIGSVLCTLAGGMPEQEKCVLEAPEEVGIGDLVERAHGAPPCGQAACEK
jgi:hypothetical protein